MKSTAIQQLEELLAEYNNPAFLSHSPDAQTVAINQEQRLIKATIDALLWQTLSDDEKQAKRKAKVNIMNKMAYETGGNEQDLVYEKSVVDLYDAIEYTFSKIEGVAAPNALIVRLKTYLIIEKMFINAENSFSKLKHMDYYLWKNIFADLAPLQQEELGLNKLYNCFINMYNHWPNRPYKEIV